jgi:hypothetical protein
VCNLSTNSGTIIQKEKEKEEVCCKPTTSNKADQENKAEKGHSLSKNKCT